MTSIAADGNELAEASAIIPLLRRWAHQYFEGAVDVCEVARLPGHSGITFTFAIRRAGTLVDRLVIKVPPLGVAQRNNTDVLRQVPILRLMSSEGVRVPRIRASGTAEEGPFPVPYLIVEHVSGRMPGDIFTGPLKADHQETVNLFDQAIAELSAIHAAPWNPEMTSWSQVHYAQDEIDHWVPVLQKAQDQSWIDRGMAVRQRLVETMPSRQQTGIVHGDYYSNNWLFADGGLTAVLDWENSCIGPQLVDIGWLCMMYDAESWGPTRRGWMSNTLNPEWILARYERHAGRSVAYAPWYRALAGYRLACLTAYYLRLHRLARRVDPVWEVFGEAFPYLLGRAETLLKDSDREPNHGT